MSSCSVYWERITEISNNNGAFFLLFILGLSFFLDFETSILSFFFKIVMSCYRWALLYLWNGHFYLLISFVSKSTLFCISMVISAFFCLVFACYIFCYFTFILSMFSYLKHISWKHVIEPCFLIQSDNLKSNYSIHPWWIVMLSIFSYKYWLSAFPILRNIYAEALPIFRQGHLFCC